MVISRCCFIEDDTELLKVSAGLATRLFSFRPIAFLDLSRYRPLSVFDSRKVSLWKFAVVEGEMSKVVIV